jgi:hypothetical protein
LVNVVLQDDAILHVAEEPGDGTADAEAVALVHNGVEQLDLTGPVDLLLDQLANGGHLLGFAGTFGAGAVAGYEQACGSHGPDGVDHLTQGVDVGGGGGQAIRRRGMFTIDLS